MRRLAVLLLGILPALPSPAQPEVWFVPGWRRCHVPEPLAWSAVTNVFSDARVVFMDWDGNGGWSRSVANADAAVSNLVDRLVEQPEGTRTNLTLVGHSLGGRIVVKTLAELADRDIRIGQGITLAAAIPADDPAVARVGGASCRPVVVLNNPGDRVLKYPYRMSFGVHGPALGLTGPAYPLRNVWSLAVSADTIREARDAEYWGEIGMLRNLALHHPVFYFTEFNHRKDEVTK